MNSAAGLSVLMPVYNGMPYLPQAVASVLSQNHPDFELLVLDDASQDGSRKFLQDLRDPRVRTIQNEKNQGLFKSLNRLAESARHDDLKIFCQDDELVPGGLLRQHNFLRNLAGGVAVRCLSTADRPWATERGARRWEGELPTAVRPAAADLVFLTFGNVMGNLSQTMVKRAALKEIGGFRQKFPFAGDMDCWVRLARCGSLGLQNEALVMVRSHERQGSKVLGRRHELYAQLDEILDPLFLRASPQDRGLLRVHRSLLEGSMQTLQAGRAMVRGDLVAFRRAWRSSPSRFPPMVCAWLGILSGFGRIGSRWTTSRLLARILQMNKETDGMAGGRPAG